MPSREEGSLQAQTQLAQAQNSVESFARAVMQAQSHPDDQTVEQAANALEHAQQALSNANPADGAEADALRIAREQLETERKRLDEARQSVR